MDVWGDRKRNPGTAKINSPDSFTVTVEVFALSGLCFLDLFYSYLLVLTNISVTYHFNFSEIKWEEQCLSTGNTLI